MDEENKGRKRSSDGSTYEERQQNLMRREFKFEAFTFEQKLAVLRTMFPFVSSKAALQETHFVRGYACSCRIFAMETREEWESVKQYLEVALTEYQRSYEEAGTPEAVANLLWALCMGYTLSVDGETVRAESEVYIRDCYETGLLLVDILREYKVYEALAEYYNTLLHVIGMDGNGVGADWCKAVGRT